MNPTDVQGLVVRGYGRLPYAAYVLLRFLDDPGSVRRWLRAVTHQIDNAVPKEVGKEHSPTVRVNIAFTFQGLKKLGLQDDELHTFPFEFAEGLGAPWARAGEPDHRSRILGDIGDSRPDNWEWGYRGDDTRIVHAVLLVFADHPDTLNTHVDTWVAKAVDDGAIARGTERVLYGSFRRDDHSGTHGTTEGYHRSPLNREPFGFADGISQPMLKSASARLAAAGESRQPHAHEVEDGEILLGYRDGTGMIPASPSVRAQDDPTNVLPAADPLNGVDRHDLGINGTYLVFRQLSQNVTAFNDACAQAAASTGLTADQVGALMVGRWKDGSPLISAPIAPDPSLARLPAANDFVYGDDPDGTRCPVGSHIRRSNPRDSLSFGPETSLRIAQRHRILRRGRPYESGDDVGLHFICLNASIARQFEFIQQNWINDSTFDGVNHEDDPLVGARQAGGTGFSMPPPATSRMTRQAVDVTPEQLEHDAPVAGLQRFVTVKGGGYFFLPGLAALRYLSADAAPVSARPRHLAWQARPATPTLSDRLRLFALTRVSHVSVAVLLLLAPLVFFLPDAASAVLGPTFDLDHWWEMTWVAMLTSLSTAGACLTRRMLVLYAWPRFKVRTTITPITWGGVLRHQAISLPIVTLAWLRSSRDATIGHGLSWAYLGFGAAAVAGYVLAFLGIRLAAALHSERARSTRQLPMLLPATTMSATVERLARPLACISEWIVPMIEQQAARLSRETTAGYVDADGRLLPGHLTLLSFLLVLALLYVGGWFFLRPIGLYVGVLRLQVVPAPGRFQIPPLGFLTFTILALGVAGSSATFLFDRYRVPLLSIIGGWCVFASMTAGTDHQFSVRSQALVAAPSLPDLVAVATQTPPTDPDEPIVIVAAAGGGIRQTVWTTQVLTGLTTLWPQFPQRVQLISAVSGGSLGALYFAHGYGTYYSHQPGEARDPSVNIHTIVDASATSGSSDIWWGLTYPDSARAVVAFFPTLLFPRTWDRGWALERAWARSLGFTRHDEPTLNSWRMLTADNKLPALAFNATVVETGQRAVFATYGPGPKPTSETGAGEAARRRRLDVEAMDIETLTCHHDVSIATAVRLSAAFPYVTPAARAQTRPHRSNTTPSPAQERWQKECADGSRPHVADGGYWDNFGVVTALEWLRATHGSLAHRRVLLIQIEPHAEPTSPTRDRSWVWQATSPLTTLLSVRANAQRLRNDEDVQALQKAWNGDKRPGEPGTLSAVRIVDSGRSATLGWHLSRRERCSVEKAWWEDIVTEQSSTRAASGRDTRTVMQSLEELFGTRAPAHPMPDPDCER